MTVRSIARKGFTLVELLVVITIVFICRKRTKHKKQHLT